MHAPTVTVIKSFLGLFLVVCVNDKSHSLKTVALAVPSHHATSMDPHHIDNKREGTFFDVGSQIMQLYLHHRSKDIHFRPSMQVSTQK